MKQFYSNGKLLITGEYLVLEGATSFALPTKFGQDLTIEPIRENHLIWVSFDENKHCWFEAVFDLPKLRLINATFSSKEEGSQEKVAETLQTILQETRTLNPQFLQSTNGFIVKTNLTFPRNWGLGSSSTLINNIAQLAKVDAYKLLWNAFSGSGYDIACAQNNRPILYQLNLIHQQSKRDDVVVNQVDFNPPYKNQLFFVHLNKKQNSREGILRFKEKKGKIDNEINRVSEISRELINATSLLDFESLITEHENIISKIIELPKVKELYFSDYFGKIKSLGAWGGDFILATGNENTIHYFKSKGYKTVVPYTEMIL